MTDVIFDTETDNLLDKLTKLHLIQIGDADGDDSVVYSDDPVARSLGAKPLDEGLARLRSADRVIAHNGIKFDFHVINRFHPGTISREKLLDTLVMARLSDPEEREHSLEAWGKRTGVYKGDYKGGYDKVTKEFYDYSVQDIHAGRALWQRVKHVLEWGESCALEHDVAWAIAEQEVNGFGFDVASAQKLEGELRQELADIDRQLQPVFPPLPRSSVFVPKANNSKLGYRKGVPFTKRWMEVFNPGSRIQIEQRLTLLGWKPRQKTPDGRAKIDETVLSKLKYPGCDLLLKRFTVEKMLGQVSDGKNGWLKCVTKEGRIHGRVNPNGACTGRMSHSKPNVAQADKSPRVRSLWVPRVGWKLVGCDAEGLEARMLAHYLGRYDKGSFANMLLNGVKEEGTDVHSMNAKAIQKMGWPLDREGAKTLLYAMMYGAGDPKLGMTILDRLRTLGLTGRMKLPPRELGIMARRALATSMVGIDKLTADITAAIKAKGYLRGIDGRHVKIRSPHSALNTLLQGAGAIVMKQALRLFMDHSLVHENWVEMGLCANVHDEVQIECAPWLSQVTGEVFAECIELAGEHFNLKCPLAGKAAVGNNWSQTH